LRYTPNHVLVERTSRVDIRGANPNNTLVLLNGQRISSYSRLDNGPDLNSIPVSSIDKVEVLKDGESAIYGSDAVAGVVNFVLRTSGDLSGATNEYKDYWQPYVKDVFSKPNTNITLDDILFGDGKLQVNIVPQGEYMIETRNYTGPSGITRLNINRQFDREGSMYEEKNYFDCSGLQLQKEVNLTDPYGYTSELYEIHYENGIPAFGYRDLAPGNAFLPYRQAYNIGTGSIDASVAPGLWQSYNFNFNKTCKNDKKDQVSEAMFYSNLLFGGLSYLIEDSYEPFCMFGGGLNYTRLLTPQLGIGLDLGYYSGKQYMWDYTKFNIMAGPEFFPFNNMRSIDKFSISPFVYLGASILSQEYNNYKDSETTFSGLGGVNLGYRLSPQINIKAGAAINPVFYENEPAWNKRLDLGVRFRF
ncbi:MAG TPA: TonB-dependent receptor, partial [Flavisolibacter sp.]